MTTTGTASTATGTTTSQPTSTDTGVGTGTTAGSTGATTDCEPNDDISPCDPPRRPMVLDFRLDAKGAYDEDDENYEESCTVMTAALELADVALTLVCLDAMNEVSVHEIRVTLDPPATVPPVTAGDEVTLRVVTEVFLEVNTRFIAVLDADQELALAFVGAPNLPTPDFIAPLVATPASVCPQTCPDMACGFIVSECPCDERLAIDFSVGAEPVRVYDGNLGTPVPALPYDLRVEAARCHDGPTNGINLCPFTHCWFRFLVLRVP